MKNSFSVIIPIHGDRTGKVPIQSLLNQKGDWEHNLEVVVVEDDNAHLNPFYLFRKNIKVVAHHDVRLEREISRSQGMASATKDWFWWLDSDDELVSSALYLMDYCINKYPDYKVFNFGGIVYWEPKDESERDYDARTNVREPADLEEDTAGMKPFKTGLIASGHFVFHRSVYEDLGGLPMESSPYAFADRAKEEFPEFKDPNSPFYLVDTLGNPHGDDYYYAYKITRKYKMKRLPLLLYIQHVRR